MEIDLVDNPRNEATENELLVDNKGLLGLGLEPTTLQDDLLREVTQVASRYLDRVDRARIPCTSRWTRSEADAQVPPLQPLLTASHPATSASAASSTTNGSIPVR